MEVLFHMMVAVTVFYIANEVRLISKKVERLNAKARAPVRIEDHRS